MPRGSKIRRGAEDVHHFVGKASPKNSGARLEIHTGAARNELVATDFRLFVIDAVAEVQRGLKRCSALFCMQAKANIGVPMAGMTHMQHRSRFCSRISCSRTPRHLRAISRVCNTPRKRGCLSDGLGCARRKFFRDRPPTQSRGTWFFSHHCEQS